MQRRAYWGVVWFGSLQHKFEWLPVLRRVQHEGAPGELRPSHRQRWAATNACAITQSKAVREAHRLLLAADRRAHTPGSSQHTCQPYGAC